MNLYNSASRFDFCVVRYSFYLLHNFNVVVAALVVFAAVGVVLVTGAFSLLEQVFWCLIFT